jgi:predicted helicase
VGQDSESDDGKNLSYPTVDTAIRQTYAARSSAGLKRNIYDSYVRAFRWASDRIGERGVVCFVSNGSYVDTGSFDGFRKSLTEEFAESFGTMSWVTEHLGARAIIYPGLGLRDPRPYGHAGPVGGCP